MESSRELKGLGGWLILVGVGVVLRPILILVALIGIHIPIFVTGRWSELSLSDSESYIPWFGTLFIAEALFNLMLLAASVVAVVLYFSKHHLFPKLYIAILAAMLVFIPLDAWAITLVLEGTTIDEQTLRDISRAIAGAAIWIPYMLVSKRVKATFVNRWGT